MTGYVLLLLCLHFVVDVLRACRMDGLRFCWPARMATQMWSDHF